MEFLCRKKPVFELSYNIGGPISVEMLYRILVCIDKYYSDYVIISNHGHNISPWKDHIINSESLLIANNRMNFIGLGIPVYYQNEKELVNVHLLRDSCIELYYDYESSEKIHSLIVSFYVDIYTNTNYRFVDGNYYKVDQSRAAKINRDILSSFLENIQVVLGDNVYEILSYHIDQKYIGEYGIKEDAVLKRNYLA